MTIATTDQYGDFNRGRLSWGGNPWLLDRLQSIAETRRLTRPL